VAGRAPHPVYHTRSSASAEGLTTQCTMLVNLATFHEVWELERFQTAQQKPLSRAFKGIGNGAI